MDDAGQVTTRPGLDFHPTTGGNDSAFAAAAAQTRSHPSDRVVHVPDERLKLCRAMTDGGTAVEESVHLGLPYIMPSQAQKHVTHNEAVRILDALVQLAVLDRHVSAPPPSPGSGDRYIVPSGATGAWAGHDGKVAAFLDGGWVFLAPRPGWITWIVDEATLLHWNGGAWTNFADAITTLQNMALLGIGTSADAINPFAAKLNKVLWTALTSSEGGDGDLRYTLNKETASDVLSLLMQTGFSSRAELGLIGSDDLCLKVSPDGSAWTVAMSVDRTSGSVRLPNGSAANPALAVGTAGTGWRRDAASGRLSASVDGLEQAWFNRGGKLGLRKRVLVTKPNIVQRTSLTGANWLASSTPADNDWAGIAWASELGLFAAVASTGTGNRVMTSPDGVTWTARSSAADNSWTAITWSPERGVFAAVANSGSGNRVMTSTDGVTWTARSSSADNLWNDVCWASEPGLFVAVSGTGSGNRVMTSPDGITWTSRSSAAENSWRSVAWAPELGLFAAVSTSGTGNRVMTSPDGVAWTSRTSAADNSWNAIIWSPELGLFAAVAFSGTGNRVMTSPDGINWTTRTTPADLSWNEVAWAPEIGLFAAVATTGTGNRVMTSPDGIVWTSRTSAGDIAWRSVAWAPELGLFGAVANSGSGNRAMTSRSAYAVTYRS